MYDSAPILHHGITGTSHTHAHGVTRNMNLPLGANLNAPTVRVHSSPIEGLPLWTRAVNFT